MLQSPRTRLSSAGIPSIAPKLGVKDYDFTRALQKINERINDYAFVLTFIRRAFIKKIQI